MTSEKKVNSLTINELESLEIYDYLKENSQLMADEVYLLSPEGFKSKILEINEAQADIKDMIAQSDWDQNDESQPGYIKNRPFYEASQIAFSWDGDYNSVEFVTKVEAEGIKAGFCKVSNTPISFTSSGYVLSLVSGNENDTSSYDYEGFILNQTDNYVSFHEGHGSAYVYSVSADSVEIESMTLTKGIWSIYIEQEGQVLYVAELRGAQEVKKIDSKFLPDTVATKEDVEIAIDAINVQSDWNQNDPEAKDYVKNRTHYSTFNDSTILQERTIETTIGDDGVPVAYITPNWDYESSFIEGTEYIVNFNGDNYHCVAQVYDYNFDWHGALGDISYSEPFTFIPDIDDETGELYGYFFKTEEAGVYTVSVSYEEEICTKIDEKYISSDIARARWVEDRIRAHQELPLHDESDNGKFLRVVNGTPAWATVQNIEEVEM